MFSYTYKIIIYQWHVKLSLEIKLNINNATLPNILGIL